MKQFARGKTVLACSVLACNTRTGKLQVAALLAVFYAKMFLLF
jgi:hypothetical protein